MIISLLTSIAIFAAPITPDSIQTEGLDYKSTKNKSMSKYQRINYVESYLENLKKSVTDLDKEVEVGLKNHVLSLSNKVLNLEKKVSDLSQQLKEMKKDNIQPRTLTKDKNDE